ncbi:MAG: group II intron reverse transcriptase domain-containing protein [Candidatus Aenigmarchaeota archaeon]|nr:group II intron reverse transcriptase domain-containing protein [Candidatus Aenigmarchaeota archaeon]
MAKTYENLYERLCSFENLHLAYRKARKNKRHKKSIIEFELLLEENLLQLKHELETMTYDPRPMKQFVIRDPKTRVISASAFRDRVVHHALCNIIEPIFDKAFIYDSYANRKGKGTLAALNRFDYFVRKLSANGKLLPNAKDNNQIFGYALKADIRHYFDSVDHEVMMRVIGRRIKDEKLLWLIKKILDNYNGEKQHNAQGASIGSGKGMPIGNLTSQFFANVYLNELDYFVKHKLKAKRYIRYVDDFVILDASKEKLESYKPAINAFLKTIKLELHPQKSKVVPLQSGVKLLGFRIFYNYKLLKRSNARRIPHRVQNFIELYADGIMDTYEIFESMEGWNAYAMHGNTYRFRRALMKKLYKSLNRIDAKIGNSFA